MSEFKIHRKHGWTTISNGVLQDKRLSFKARGIMAFMLSVQNIKEWDYSVSGLVAKTCEKHTSVQTGLKELEKYGYLIREQGTFNGRFTKSVYHLYEEPQGVFPLAENPSTEIPLAENPQEKNNNLKKIINKKNNNTADEVLSEIYDLYQNNIHPFTGQIEYQALTEAIKDFGAANVKEAIVIAAKNNGRSVSYVEKVAQNLSNGLNFDKKKASAPAISEEQRKRFEDILRGKIAIKDCTKLECKAITECGGTWEMKNRLEKDNDKWLRNLCNAYMELANGVREQDS